jgi:hypothetical protein
MVGNHLRGKAFGRLIRPLSRELARLDFEHVANRASFTKSAVEGLTPRAELTPDFSPTDCASTGAVKSKDVMITASFFMRDPPIGKMQNRSNASKFRDCSSLREAKKL